MSGGHRFPYPKYVWSPAGGWWANPVHWKRNTAIYVAFMGLACYGLVSVAEPRKVTIYRLQTKY